MSKQLIYRLIIVVLLISNLLLLGFCFYSKPPHPPMPKQIIIKKLNFDKAQIAKFEVLIKSHRDGIIAREESIKTKKNELYSSLAETANNSKTELLISEIGKSQTEIENLHYKHFEEIKKLCREEQLPAFKELSKELVNLFFRHRMKRK